MRIGVFGGTLRPAARGAPARRDRRHRAAGPRPRGPRAGGAAAAEAGDGASAPAAASRDGAARSSGGDPRFAVDPLEIDRGGLSLHGRHARDPGRHGGPGAELFLLAGADVLQTFAKWREPETCPAAGHPGGADARRRGVRADGGPARLPGGRRAAAHAPGGRVVHRGAGPTGRRAFDSGLRARGRRRPSSGRRGCTDRGSDAQVHRQPRLRHPSRARAQARPADRRRDQRALRAPAGRLGGGAARADRQVPRACCASAPPSWRSGPPS